MSKTSGEKQCPVFLTPVPEEAVLVDFGEVWTDAYLQAKMHWLDLNILRCQSSLASLQSIMSMPGTLSSWMHSKPNRQMLKKYQEAMQLYYFSDHLSVEASGTLHITTHHGDMTAACVFNISHPSDIHTANTEDDDFEDQRFEPEVRVILTDFAPVMWKKPMKKPKKNDTMKLVAKGAGTPRRSVKKDFGNAQCNSQSQTSLAKRYILQL